MTTAKEQNASGKQAQQQDQVTLLFLDFKPVWDLRCVALCFLCDFLNSILFWCAFLKWSTESPVSGRRKVLCIWAQGLLSVCVEACGGGTGGG